MSTVTDFVYRTVEVERVAGAELGMDIVVEDTGVLVMAVRLLCSRTDSYSLFFVEGGSGQPRRQGWGNRRGRLAA